jgi:RimJ/RimL family protein N-acetyltransferase
MTAASAPDARPGRPPELTLRGWDEDLLRQMAAWSPRGFPYAAFDLDYLKDRRRAREVLSWARLEWPHRHFVACEGGTAVGRASVNLDDQEGLYLWAVHVPPEHAGRGVARAMVRMVMDLVWRRHPDRAFVLTTNTFAEPAHRVYYSLGFKVDRTMWRNDESVALGLWRMTEEQRLPFAGHIRFANGRWECRQYLMRCLPRAAQAPGSSSSTPTGQ